LKLVSRIRVITHPRGRLGTLGQPQGQRQQTPLPPFSRGQCILIAMGASTGGPSAIVEVLRGLPATLPVPLLLVLHINEPFGLAFADWLDGQTDWRVKYAQDCEPIGSTGGRVIMAPPGSHLVVRDGRLHLTLDPELHSCRPSVDVLFQSVARECGSRAAACLLTGMGRDGASGLLDVRKAGVSRLHRTRRHPSYTGCPGRPHSSERQSAYFRWARSAPHSQHSRHGSPKRS